MKLCRLPLRPKGVLRIRPLVLRRNMPEAHGLR